MGLGSLLRQTLEVRRTALVSPAAYDDNNLPLFEPEAVIATVPGQIEPLTIAEQQLTNDMGPVATDSRAYLLPTDVRTGDRIRRVDTNEYFDVRAVLDAAGRGTHLELDLDRVAS